MLESAQRNQAGPIAMGEIANLCLRLSSRAENVLVVRQALTGFAEALGLDALETNDIATAVTEACNNVVMHAYPDGEGPMEVEVCAASPTVVVTARDHGVGTEDSAEAARGERGIGLPVMRALASQVVFSVPDGGGTEVRMEFAAPKAHSVVALEEEWRPPQAVRTRLAGTVEMTLAPEAIARTVLPRVLSALAARAYFSTDRISDLQLVSDALVARSGDSIVGSHMGLGVRLAPRDLELRVGPLRRGAGEMLLSQPGPGVMLRRLTDEQQIDAADSAEVLALRILEAR